MIVNVSIFPIVHFIFHVKRKHDWSLNHAWGGWVALLVHDYRSRSIMDVLLLGVRSNADVAADVFIIFILWFLWFNFIPP